MEKTQGNGGNGSRPRDHVHDIYMEQSGGDRFLEEMAEVNAGIASQGKSVEHPYVEILKVTNALTRLVQTGRYVSKAQLTEVDQIIKSSNGFFRG